MEDLLMSAKERARLEIFGRVSAGDLTLVKASELLKLSYRQTKRSWSRYKSDGAAGLIHGLRGRQSNRQPDETLKSQALELYAAKYADYGPTLAAECLQQDDQLCVPAETLRGWLISAGLWHRKRRRQAHRRRRPRKEHFGEMIQMDGSIHDWFEGRRGEAVLMVMIDDATGFVLARFFEQETLRAAWTTFREWVQRHGLPQALYVDRHSIYRSDKEPTAEQLLAGEDPPTQFGRSMQDLGVRLIKARSPQAKGRVERMNATLQDRLVKALRRAGISDLESANRFLDEGFFTSFNDRFKVAAVAEGDLHRPVDSSCDLDQILSVQETRVVQNDWTVRWKNQFLQLLAGEQIQPGAAVTICEQLNGQLRVFSSRDELPWSSTPSPPPKSPPQRQGEIRSHQGQRPPENHPWRRFRLHSTPRSSPELASSVPDSLRSSSTPPANSEDNY